MNNRRNRLAYPTGPTMRIDGKTVSVVEVKHSYRCRECLGVLRFRDNTVACAADVSHSGLVHKSEAAEIAASRAVEQVAIEAEYQVIDGKLVPRKGINEWLSKD